MRFPVLTGLTALGCCLANVAALDSLVMQADRAMPVARQTNDSAAASGDNTTANAIKPSYDPSSCPGYKVAGDVKQGKSGFTVPLQLAGPACNAYGVDVKDLTLAVVYEKPHVLHVHIYDTAKEQYQLPLDMLFTRPDSDPDAIQDGATADSSHLTFHHTAEQGGNGEEGPWAFWITRKNSDTPIFDTRPANIPTYADSPVNGTTESNRNATTMPNHNIIFENQYLQLSSALPRDANLYGLGERYSAELIGETSWRLNPDNFLQPFFTLDAGDPVKSNMYGYHPVYLEVRNGTQANQLESHVVYYQNTAGLDVLMRPGVIQYRAIGGTLDFRFFSGDAEDVSAAPADENDTKATTSNTVNTPQTAMEQYVEFANLPIMVPDWSFGYHQLRWGLKTTNDMREIRQAMRDADIPLEVMWNDIDWLEAFRNFVRAPDRYGDLPAFIKELNDAHQHWIPIVDAAIPAAPQNDSDTYLPGTRGQELDVFLKNPNGTNYIGQVWPGYTFFTDEHHPNAQQWWNEAIKNMSDATPFSGIWNDMMEPSSFIVGSAGDPNNLSGGNTAHQTATSVDGWPEGYDNTTSGNSGNVTVDGKSTYTGDHKFYVKRALIAEQEEQRSIPGRLQRKRQDGDNSDRPFNPDDFHYSPANHVYENTSTRFLWDPPYAIHNGIHDSEGPLVDNLNKKTVAMDTVAHGGIKFYDVHNIDGALMLQRIHDSLLALRPDERPFIVGRSSYVGTGKYGSHWLGDDRSHWGSLNNQIAGGLQFQLFGIPTVGADTCGFSGNTDEDLCNRWMMHSAFMPFYRNHNVEGAISQEPYRWDSVANASRIAIKKRYELLPELYTARARSSQKGTPMMKSLWMEFDSADHFERLRKTDNQYMLGSNLLVSPVLEPNASTVKAYFPEAKGQWRNIFTYEALDVPANENTTIAAPLSSINVHLRPGRAILSYAQAQYTIFETKQEPFTLLVNLDADQSANGNSYLDDGSSNLPTPSRELTFAVQNATLTGQSTGEYKVNNTLDNVILMGVTKKPSKLASGDRDLLPSTTFDEQRGLLNVTRAQIDVNQEKWSITWSD